MKKDVLLCITAIIAIGLTPVSAQNRRSHGKTMTLKNNREITVGKHAKKAVFSKTTAIFSEDFSNGLPGDWITADKDGDGFGWEYDNVFTNTMVSYSYDNDGGNPLNPDNYLITPQIAVPTGSGAVLSFDIAALDGDWPYEHFSVLASPSGNPATDSFTVNLLDDTIRSDSYATIRLSLSQFAGDTIRIAFRHHDSVDMFGISLSYVEIYEPDQVDIAVTGANTPSYITTSNSETLSATVENLGSLPQYDIPVYCDVNGTIYTDTIASLTSLQSSVATFTGIDMSQTGSYDIRFYTNVQGDANPSNDTLHTQAVCVPPASLSWDFEGTNTLPRGFSVASYDGAVAHNTDIFPNNEPWNVHDFSEEIAADEMNAGLDGGTNSAVAQSWFTDTYSETSANRWLILPTITLTSGNGIMWDATSYEEEFPESYAVKISTSDLDTASFTTIFSTTEENPEWTRRTADLSAYSGQDVHIAFVLNSTDQNLLLIDNIKILGNATSPDNPVALQLADDGGVSIFPNPASERIFLTSESGVVSVEIIDLTGRTVLRQRGNAKEIDIRKLHNGVYTVRTATEKGISMKRLIKK